MAGLANDIGQRATVTFAKSVILQVSCLQHAVEVGRMTV